MSSLEHTQYVLLRTWEISRLEQAHMLAQFWSLLNDANVWIEYVTRKGESLLSGNSIVQNQ
jgi:hypothetical protein